MNLFDNGAYRGFRCWREDRRCGYFKPKPAPDKKEQGPNWGICHHPAVKLKQPRKGKKPKRILDEDWYPWTKDLNSCPGPLFITRNKRR